MVLKNNKKHIILHNSNVGLGEDKISNLPDELIHRILSLLSTKCGMSTCILSQRWKYLSNSIPTLDFRWWRRTHLWGNREEEEQETRCLMDFLDTVLFVHEKPNIQKFYLDDLDEFFNVSRVNRWIRTIMKRNIEEFGLSIGNINTSCLFPLSFFTCDSLTLLDLNFLTYTGGKFNIPNTVSFPKLKILRLRNPSFLNETSTRKLFSNCPILEELSLSDYRVYEDLCIVNPTLKHLSICCDCYFAESILEISAPNLLTMKYISKGYPPDDFVLSNFPSLVEAYVDFGIDREYEYPNKSFFKLLKKLSKAKILKICATSFLVLSEADILLTDFPSFNNLIHLEAMSDYEYECLSFGTVRGLFRFLQISPNLESIVFGQSLQIRCHEQNDRYWSLDPNCLSPHLKSIKFMDFLCRPKELNAVKLFLRYANSLETVTIVAFPGCSDGQQLNVAKQLLMFPRPAKCVIRFLSSSEKA